MLTNKNAKDDLNLGERCYPDKAAGRTLADHLARYNFAKDFVKDKIVLDIACGEGYGSDILNKAGAREVWGIDNDVNIIEAARQKYPGINFISAQAAGTPLKNDYFDVIISFETWHHLDNWRNFISEMHRILEPDGLLLVSVPNEKVIYLNPFHRKFLTKFYRTDFNKRKIGKFLKNYFKIKQWYGQRRVKEIYLNFLVKSLLYFGQLVSRSVRQKVDAAFKLADGPKVKPLAGDNARYFVVLCRKIN